MEAFSEYVNYKMPEQLSRTTVEKGRTSKSWNSSFPSVYISISLFDVCKQKNQPYIKGIER